ncbi:beta-1,3-galactosyltransferase 1-like [Esox lucius]|uniref:Hexosyltransferase n=1 Tax=Esox lucius TaxID=8010 RepID=A0A3P8YIR9_ESOLU|nr:beta-1,3-galactosyltransferase 1-like [Esox lucius]
MVENSTKKGGKSQQMAESRKYCSFSRCHICFLFLLTVAIMIYYITNQSAERAPSLDWTLKWWKEYGIGSAGSGTGAVSPTSSDISVYTQKTASAQTFQDSADQQTPLNKSTSPQTQINDSTRQGIKLNKTYNETSTITTALLIPTLTTIVKAILPLTDLATEDKAVQTTLVPYVSPGPYHVEYPHEYHFLLDEPEKCREENPFLVLIVPVEPFNRQARDAIRSTWGSEKQVLGKEVRLFFLVALPRGDGAELVMKQLLQESRERRDLLQSDFIDCYKNLTIKTMVMMEWLSSRCPNASYAMKIDSDMFLNVNTLVDMVLHAREQNYMTGLVARWGAVLRDPSSKWYLPKREFPENIYPPYALGLGYVFSMDLPRKLVEASRHVKAVYIEDVYLGLCMRHLGIQPTDPPAGNLFNVLPVHYNRCVYSRLVATTTYSLIDQVNAWRDLHKPGPPC